MTNSMAIETSEEVASDDDIVLSVQGVSKKFCRSLKKSLFYGIQDIISELLGFRQNCGSLRSEEFWALKDVNVQLHRGESLGLVGANGSGKTTLLRIISGLIRPDTGKVQIWGRVAPLIALGAGFNPILTGRENIYANMSILGLSTQEIDAQFDAVVEFAEIGEAIEAPVQSYSSGMAARLGFACAVHTNPDILLIDEVLAVGDIRFRAKCERRLSELQQTGTSFVLVSHSFQGILNLCSSAIYLAKGTLIASGDARTIMDQYEQDLFSIHRGGASTVPIYFPEKTEQESSGVDILSIYFKDGNGDLLESPVSSEPISICVKCNVRQPVDNLSSFMGIYQTGRDNSLALHMSSVYDGHSFPVSVGTHEICAYLPQLGLLPGAYALNVYVKDGLSYMLDAYESLSFSVIGKDNLNRGLFYQPRTWQVASEMTTLQLSKDFL